MRSVVVLVRASVVAADAKNLLAYFEDASRRASEVAGFHGGRVYRNDVDIHDHLILWHYRDVASAEEGLVAIAQGPALPQRQTAGRSPADVMRVKVLQTRGLSSDGLPDGAYLSVSVRVAEPGRGKNLASELENIFAELEFIPGCLGSLVAANDTLDEEILGLVGWSTVEAFQQSLPAGVPYEVRLYERLA